MSWKYDISSNTIHSSVMIDGQRRDLVTEDTTANRLRDLIRNKGTYGAANIYQILETIFNISHRPIDDVALCVDAVGEYYIKIGTNEVGRTFTLVIEKLFTGLGTIMNYTPGADLHLTVQQDVSGEDPTYSILDDTIGIDWWLPEE